MIPARRPDHFLARGRLQTYSRHDRKRCLRGARILRDLQKRVEMPRKWAPRMQGLLSGLNTRAEACGGLLRLSLQTEGRRTCEPISAEGYGETGGRSRRPGRRAKKRAEEASGSRFAATCLKPLTCSREKPLCASWPAPEFRSRTALPNGPSE
jgi:hypothetical protein